MKQGLLLLGCLVAAAGCKQAPPTQMETGYEVMTVSPTDRMISSTYSAAGSALTALTTSFTVDILEGTRRYDDRRLTRIRKRVHVGMAVLMGLLILCFEAFGNDSVINLVYKVASYTYGPILGMFAFGIFTRWKVRDRWMPLVAIAAPLLSGLLQYAARTWWNYHIGFELLIYNALFTMLGMLLLVRKKDEK